MSRRTGPGRWLVPTVVLLVLAPVGLAAWTAVGRLRGDVEDPARERSAVPRRGSEPVDPAGAKAVVERRTTVPGSYDITYRIASAGGRGKSSRERVRVLRPFDGRVTTTAPGASSASERVSRLGALVLPTGSGPRRLEVPPALAASDLRFDIVIPDALEDRRIERREQRLVAGRRCQVYRFGSTVLSGEIVSIHDRAGEHADVCVDADGLLLEELWVKGGRTLRQKVAVAVATAPALDAAVFRLPDEQPIPPQDGSGLFRAVDPATSVEGTSWIVTPPDGFTFAGRFVAQDARIDTGRGRADGASAPSTSVQQVDVYTRGSDAIVATTIVEADAGASLTPPAGAPVDAGRLGEAFLTIDLRGNAITTVPVDGRSLRVFGSVAPEELLPVLRSAEPVVGRGLVFL